MKIGEICESISSTLKKSLKDVVLINTSDVFDGKVTNHNYVPNKNLRGQFKKSFQKGDILYSEIRPKNRRFAFVDFDATDYVASTKLMVLRANGQVIPEFLYHLLKSEKIINQLQILAETRSGTFPQITFSELASIEVTIPPLKEQRLIASTISFLDDKIENNAKINHHLPSSSSATDSSPDIRRGKSVSRSSARRAFSLQLLSIVSKIGCILSSNAFISFVAGAGTNSVSKSRVTMASKTAPFALRFNFSTTVSAR